MKILNFRISYFWDAVHPIFRAPLFFYLSYWAAKHLDFDSSVPAGVYFWWSLFALAFFIAALHTLFWMEWHLEIPSNQQQALRSIRS